jgi:glutathione S-transferase
MDKYKLYWEILSGAIAPQMMLEEIGAPYERVSVDMEAGDHKTEDYLSINPTGQVPALRMPDGTVIGESAAIILVLGERHPRSGLVPLVTEPDRAIFLYWLLFMATSMYMGFVRSNHPERFTLDHTTTESIRLAALEALDRNFGVLDRAIQGSPFFLARGFSALDAYLTMLLVWHPNLDQLFEQFPNVGALYHATNERPACARVMAEHNPPR